MLESLPSQLERDKRSSPVLKRTTRKDLGKMTPLRYESNLASFQTLPNPIFFEKYFQDKGETEKKEVEVEDRKFEPAGNDRDLVDMLGRFEMANEEHPAKINSLICSNYV